MNSGELNDVGDVVEPFPRLGASVAQAGELPVGGVQGVAEHEQQADGHAGGDRGAHHCDEHNPRVGAQRRDRRDLVRRHAQLMGHGRQDPAHGPVDHPGVQGGARLRLLRPGQVPDALGDGWFAHRDSLRSDRGPRQPTRPRRHGPGIPGNSDFFNFSNQS